MRVLIPVLTCALATGSAFSQFGIGKLKRALDTAQKVSEMNISEEDEIALGERVSANIRNHFGVVQDEKTTRYVTLVGLVLAQHGSRPNLEYHFIVLDSGVINAFAAPGGFIHITRGALASMKDEAELAGVLGHEIAHVTQRHTLEGIKKAKGLEIAQGETLRGSPAVLDKLADNMSEAILAGFGRKEELESDEVGVELASAAGYDPGGLVRFLETLKAANSGSSSKAGLFASHPETDERLKKLDKQIEKENLAAKSTVRLPERYQSSVSVDSAGSTAAGSGSDEARGLADSGGKKEGDGKGGGFLGKLSNPTGSGEKQQRAEVTGTGAGRGVGAETEEKNAAPVKTDEKAEEKQEKKGGFLGRLSNPFGSGEKQERAEVTGTGAGRGVGSETEEKDAKPVKTDEKAEEKQEKKGGFLGKLSAPFGSGEKQERAEVTGTGAGRGVGSEGQQQEAGAVRTAAVVVVQVTAKELDAFKKEGGLR